MRIGTKEYIVTAVTLATAALVAGAIWWVWLKTESAIVQRAQANEIASEFTQLRLVTFEYVLRRQQRSIDQWRTVSSHIDALIAESALGGAQEEEILSRLKARRIRAKAIFEEIAARHDRDAGQPPATEVGRRLEEQLMTRLAIMQQEGYADAFEMRSLAADRMNSAQSQVVVIALVGLALIAMMKLAGSWLMRHSLLAPVRRLTQATAEVAAGNWKSRLGIARDDEIGDLSRNFDAMVRALEGGFEQIQRNNSELGALNQELEAFSYSVSHDLRAPLRAMDGFSSVLLEDHGHQLDAQGKDALARIRGASQRMGALIDDLLRLARVSRADLRVAPVDLSVMAREIADGIDEEFPGHPVKWLIDPGLAAYGDRALLAIALSNLMRNAHKFSGKRVDSVIRVGVEEVQDMHAFFVQDNGVGFDMRHAGQLFQAFQRMHQAADFAGTGIGLAMVDRIIRRHQGKVWARAQVGEGATFYFTVPSPPQGPSHA